MQCAVFRFIGTSYGFTCGLIGAVINYYLCKFVCTNFGFVMSSSNESETEQQYNSSELKFIAQELRTCPDILAKSQVPKVKKRKDEAIAKVLQKYKAIFGKELDAKGFMKKVNNMKNRLKKKTNLRKQETKEQN